MKRLAYLFPMLAIGFGLTACPGDDSPGVESSTEGDTDEDDDDSTTTAPTTVTVSTTDTPTTTDMPTTDQPTTDDPTSSESGLPECTDKDECITADDCPIPGSSCVGCLCVGGEGCAMYGEGVFGDCLTGGVAACMGSTGAGCVVDNVTTPTAGVCYSTCEDACDCPAPPKGFEAQLTCGALVEKEGNCYISCEDGESCPDGWQCVGNYFCAIGELVELPGYGDCVNQGGECPDTMSGGAGGCLGLDPAMDGSTDEGGVCFAQPCEDVDDCPAVPATGDAVVACTDVTGDMMNDCILDCSGDATCPNGMTCHPDFLACYWEINYFDPYAECVEQTGGTCPNGPNDDAGTCLSNEDLSFCSNACETAEDCPAGLTGDATAACVDIAMAQFCVLQCGGDVVCPDNMECVNAGIEICVNTLG